MKIISLGLGVQLIAMYLMFSLSYIEKMPNNILQGNLP